MDRALKAFGFTLYVLQTVAILTKNFEAGYDLTISTTIAFILWVCFGDLRTE